MEDKRKITGFDDFIADYEEYVLPNFRRNPDDMREEIFESCGDSGFDIVADQEETYSGEAVLFSFGPYAEDHSPGEIVYIGCNAE